MNAHHTPSARHSTHRPLVGWCVLWLFVAPLMALPACRPSAPHGTPQEQVADTAQVDSLAADTLPHTLSLLFVGDLMQHKSQIDAARRPEGYSYAASFEHVRSEIERADIAIGNLECTLGGKPYAGYPCFSAPDEFLTAIHQAGFDVLSTANNHCLDRGSRGALRTLHLLDSLGIPHLGTYPDSLTRHTLHPLVVERQGFRLAFVAYTYATNGIKATPPLRVNYIDEEQMALDVARARALQPDAIFALMHWGNEYQLLPSAEQRRLAERLFDMGVTHIIGSHPHVVQPIEVRTDSLTGHRHLLVYSLGNFISGMSAKNTDGGLMVRLTLCKQQGRTTLGDAHYSLAWTLRPVHNPEHDYALVPVSRLDSLQPSARTLFTRFLTQARTLFAKHNVGIDEVEF